MRFGHRDYGGLPAPSKTTHKHRTTTKIQGRSQSLTTQQAAGPPLVSEPEVQQEDSHHRWDLQAEVQPAAEGLRDPLRRRLRSLRHRHRALRKTTAPVYDPSSAFLHAASRRDTE